MAKNKKLIAGIVLVIILLVGVAWTTDKYIHRTTNPLPTGVIHHTTDTKAYAYPSGYFKITYPSNWAIAAQTITANPTPYLEPVVALTPPSAPKTLGGHGNSVIITVYKSGNTSSALKDSIEGGTARNIQTLTIHGYKAMFQQTVPINNSKQSSIPSSYVTDDYAVTHNNVTIIFTFTVKEGAIPAFGTLSAVPAFNATSTLPAFNSIIASVDILNQK